MNMYWTDIQRYLSNSQIINTKISTNLYASLWFSGFVGNTTDLTGINCVPFDSPDLGG